MLRLDQLQMFGDRVLIDPDPKHEQSEGGLFIPPAVLKDNPNYYNMTGVVVQLGDGVMRHTFQCINCLALAPQDEGPCPGCHQPLGNKNTRLFEAGDGRYEFGVSVGERVLFNRFAGKQVEIEQSWDVFPGRPPSEADRATHEGPGEIVLSVNEYSHTEKRPKRMLIMREIEILGVVEGEHRIVPGYQAPKWGRVSDGLTV
jgi:co-chaperonin GroES (HSP10)